jgi:hypothetical protein
MGNTDDPYRAIDEGRAARELAVWFCIISPVPMFHGDASMQQRRRTKLADPLEARLAEEAKRLREEAKSLPPSAKREDLLRKARQAETGSHMSQWLSSPGLQPPR